MSQSTKRILSTIAIIIASIAFGVIISADLGIMRTSNAQTTAPEIRTSSGAIAATAVTIPSFADVAARVMPAVVSITTTEVVKTSSMQRMHPFGGIDPFDFFPNPQGPRGRGNGNSPDDNGDDER